MNTCAVFQFLFNCFHIFPFWLLFHFFTLFFHTLTTFVPGTWCTCSISPSQAYGPDSSGEKMFAYYPKRFCHHLSVCSASNSISLPVMDPLDYNQQTVTLEGLEALPFSGQIILTTLYSATAIMSFIGNSLVIIVLSLGNRLRVSDMQMRTSVTSSLSVSAVTPGDKEATSRLNFKVNSIKRANSTKPISSRNNFGQRDNLKFFLINLAWSDLAMSLFSIPFTYSDFLLGKYRMNL